MNKIQIYTSLFSYAENIFGRIPKTLKTEVVPGKGARDWARGMRGAYLSLYILLHLLDFVTVLNNWFYFKR